MKTQVNTSIKGHLKVTNHLTGEVLFDGPNALTGDAEEVLAIVIAQSDKLSQIRALQTSTTLADALITSVSFPAVNEVLMTAIFDEASFDDTLDELQLMQATSFVFSNVTGLLITKDNVTQMSVEWKLTINVV